MSKEYKLRFRHLDGDVGPLPFPESATIATMKGTIFDSWPTDGQLAGKKPDGKDHLRIMYQGKILQDTQTIADLCQLPGDIDPERVLTLHLMIAKPGQLTGTNPRRKNPEGTESTCCCVQ